MAKWYSLEDLRVHEYNKIFGSDTVPPILMVLAESSWTVLQ